MDRSVGRLLFAARSVRLFAYGGLSVVLVLYLVALGLRESDVGLLLSATLAGDTLVSLILTTRADRFPWTDIWRRRDAQSFPGEFRRGAQLASP